MLFTLKSPRDMLREGVMVVTRPKQHTSRGLPEKKGISDSMLGSTDFRVSCGTCLKMGQDCIGHSGAFKLARPIYNNMFLQETMLFLQCVCFQCSRLKLYLSDDRVRSVDAMYRDASPDVRLHKIADLCKGVRRCPHCTAVQPYRFMNKNMPTIRVVWNRDAFGDDVEQMEAVTGVPMTARVVKNIFDRISQDLVLFIMGKHSPVEVGRVFCPSDLIISVLEIQTPTVRGTGFAPGGKGMRRGTRPRDPTTQFLRKIVSLSDDMEMILHKQDDPTEDPSVEGGADAKTVEQFYLLWDKIQQNHALMLRSDARGCSSVQSRFASSSKAQGLNERIKGKEGIPRKELMGKRAHAMSRCVISPAPPHFGVSTIGIPIEVAWSMSVPVRVNRFNRDELTKIVAGGLAIYIEVEDSDTLFNLENLSPDRLRGITLEEGWYVYRRLRDGDVVCSNRFPSLHRTSILGFKALIVPGDTIYLPIGACKHTNADFDGDEKHMHPVQMLLAQTEVCELMMLPSHMMDPQTANFAVYGIQNTPLSAWKLTRQDTVLTVDNVMQMVMFADTPVGLEPLTSSRSYEPHAVRRRLEDHRANKPVSTFKGTALQTPRVLPSSHVDDAPRRAKRVATAIEAPRGTPVVHLSKRDVQAFVSESDTRLASEVRGSLRKRGRGPSGAWVSTGEPVDFYMDDYGGFGGGGHRSSLRGEEPEDLDGRLARRMRDMLLDDRDLAEQTLPVASHITMETSSKDWASRIPQPAIMLSRKYMASAAGQRVLSRADPKVQRACSIAQARREPLGLWTGKQMYSLLLPREMHLVKAVRMGSLEDDVMGSRDAEEDQVRIIRGQLITGRVDAGIARKVGGIMSHIRDLKSMDAVVQFVERGNMMLEFYLSEVTNHTVGIEDVVADDETVETVANVNKRFLSAIDRVEQRKDLTRLQKDIAIENLVMQILPTTTNVVMARLDPSNPLLDMIFSGGKGKPPNVGQMMGSMGQVMVNGARPMPKEADTAVLPYMDPKDRVFNFGLILGSLGRGITAWEAFHQALAGVSGILDTAISTQIVGAMQRLLAWILIMFSALHSDGSISADDGRYLQTVAYGDGLDPAQAQAVRLPFAKLMSMSARTKEAFALVDARFGPSARDPFVALFKSQLSLAFALGCSITDVLMPMDPAVLKTRFQEKGRAAAEALAARVLGGEEFGQALRSAAERAGRNGEDEGAALGRVIAASVFLHRKDRGRALFKQIVSGGDARSARPILLDFLTRACVPGDLTTMAIRNVQRVLHGARATLRPVLIGVGEARELVYNALRDWRRSFPNAPRLPALGKGEPLPEIPLFGPTALAEAAFLWHFHPSRLVLMGISEEDARDMVRTFVAQAHGRRVAVGEQCGVVSAYALGELIMQLTLNSFHLAGVGAGMSEATNRLKDLFMCSKNVTVQYYWTLNDPVSLDEARDVARYMVSTSLKTVAESCSVVSIASLLNHDAIAQPCRFLIRRAKRRLVGSGRHSLSSQAWLMTLDTTEAMLRGVSLALVMTALRRQWGRGALVLPVWGASGHKEAKGVLVWPFDLSLLCSVLDIREDELMGDTDGLSSVVFSHMIRVSLESIQVSGVEQVGMCQVDLFQTPFKYDPRDAGAGSRPFEHTIVLESNGGSLAAVRRLHEAGVVDIQRHRTNNALNMQSLLGVEVGRMIQIREILEVMQRSGEYVLPRHIEITAAVQAWDCWVKNIFTIGSLNGTMMDMVLERANKVVRSAAWTHKFDKLKGPIAAVAGGHPRIGTGAVDVLCQN
jgi:DNA-directed RNA polymerase beta' subunit